MFKSYLPDIKGREFCAVCQPTLVIIKMISNILTASTVLNMRVTRIGHRRRGRVTVKKVLILPAPSTFAASYRTSGMACRPTRTSSTTRGVHGFIYIKQFLIYFYKQGPGSILLGQFKVSVNSIHMFVVTPKF